LQFGDVWPSEVLEAEGGVHGYHSRA
jgi:hypothetical protein